MKDIEHEFEAALEAFRVTPLGRSVLAQESFTQVSISYGIAHVAGCEEVRSTDVLELTLPEDVKTDFMMGCCDLARPGVSLAGRLGHLRREVRSGRPYSSHRTDLLHDVLIELSAGIAKALPDELGTTELGTAVELGSQALRERRQAWLIKNGDDALFAAAARASSLLEQTGRHKLLSREFSEEELETMDLRLSEEDLVEVALLRSTSGAAFVLAEDSFFGGGFRDLYAGTDLIQDALTRYASTSMTGVLPCGLLPLVELVNKGQAVPMFSYAVLAADEDPAVLEVLERLLKDGALDLTEALEASRALV